MALTYFSVTATIKAIRTDSAIDVGGDPETQFVSSTVTFSPSVSQVYSATEDAIIRLQPIRGRTDVSDGVLHTVDGSALKLPANSAALDVDELFYDVTFSNVVYDLGAQPKAIIDGFRFLAPTTSETIDLATVERLPLPRDRTK